MAGTPLTRLAELAEHLILGEAAARHGRVDEAVSQLLKAVEMQRYNEPPTWHYPARQSLGAVLFEGGRATEAEAVHQEDLTRNRENGRSLFGLSKSPEAQGRYADAEAVRARCARAWARADVTLTASRLTSLIHT